MTRFHQHRQSLGGISHNIGRIQPRRTLQSIKDIEVVARQLLFARIFQCHAGQAHRSQTRAHKHQDMGLCEPVFDLVEFIKRVRVIALVKEQGLGHDVIATRGTRRRLGQ